MVPPPPLPPLTEREVSLHTAHAGIEARSAAAQLGGDPHQVGSLLRAADALPATGREHVVTIGGVGFHAITLAVTLATQELSRAASLAGEPVSNALFITRLAAAFHDPVEVYEMLTVPGGGLAELDAFAMGLVGHWSPLDIEAFAAHIQRCKARSPSLQPEAEAEEPGKSKPGRRMRAKR